MAKNTKQNCCYKVKKVYNTALVSDNFFIIILFKGNTIIIFLNCFLNCNRFLFVKRDKKTDSFLVLQELGEK